jgi:hypothetical protein
MGGGNPHIASDSIPPNALFYVALPFLVAAPTSAFVAYKKRLWKRVDLSELRSLVTNKPPK